MISLLFTHILSECPQEKIITIENETVEGYPGCKTFSILNFTDKVKYILPRAFRSCSSITEIYFGNNIINISEQAFQYCNSLQIIHSFPSTLTLIGNACFENCASLQEVNLSGTQLTEIPDYCFYDAHSIELIIFPSSLKALKKACLHGTHITSLTIPNLVQDISDDCYSNCQYLEDITFGSNVVNIPNNFTMCYSLKTIKISRDNNLFTVDNGIVYNKGKTKLHMFPPALDIQEFTSSDIVTEVANGAFMSSVNLLKVHLQSVTTFGHHIFAGSKRIRTVHLSSSLSTITDSFFEGVLSLRDFTLPDSITVIGSHSFSGTSIRSLTIPNGVSEIHSGAFMNSYLDNITFAGDKVILIDSYAFYGTNLTSISLNFPSLTYLGDYAFSECFSLISISITNTPLINISNGCFKECFCLTSFSFPNTIQTIGDEAFQDCWKLIGLDLESIPITTLGSKCFQNCYSFTEIHLPNSLETIGSSAFSGNKKIQELIFPDNVTTIGEECYSFCSLLSHVHFGKSVEVIPALTKDANLLVNISVSFENKHFLVHNNVLYSHNLSILYIFPPALHVANETFTTPDETRVIGDYAFAHSFFLKEVNLLKVTTLGINVFEGDLCLSKVTLPEGITSIPNYTFFAASNLDSITIPSTVRSIGSYAFEQTNIPNITLPDIEEIGEGAFSECPSLQSFVFPAKLKIVPKHCFYSCLMLSDFTFAANSQCTRIDSEAFRWCTHLINFNLPETLTQIGDRAFTDSGIESINLANVESLGLAVFMQCSYITSITLGSKLTFISNFTFYKCENLLEIDISNVIEIGQFAFGYCSALENVKWGSKLQTISHEAFYETGIKKLEIPASLTYIRDDAFFGCSQLNEIVIDNDNHLFSTDEQGTSLYDFGKTRLIFVVSNFTGKFIIPETVEDYSSAAFAQHKELTEVVLSSKITTITEYSFSNCPKLTTFNFSSVERIQQHAFFLSGLKEVIVDTSTLRYINDFAFAGCEALENINFTNDSAVEIIGFEAFADCGLLSVELPNTLKTISNQTFARSTNLAHLKLPDNYLTVPNGICLDCSALTEVIFPKNCVEIQQNAFSGCSALESIVLPDSLTVIKNSAFKGCSKLKDVKLNDGLSEIQMSAFENCYKLKNIVIPKNLTLFGMHSFYRSGLESFSVVEDNEIYKDIDGVVYSKNGVDLVIYPPEKGPSFTASETITKIAAFAFQSSEKLHNLTLPNVVDWGYGAFMEMRKLTVYLPIGCVYPEGTFESEVIIEYYDPSPSPSTSASASPSKSGKKLGTLEISLIVVGSVMFVAIIVLVVALSITVKRKRELVQSSMNESLIQKS